MTRFAKIILAVLAGVLALAVVALLAVNLYLQSGDVQQRIRAETEDAIGMPVTVKRTLYTPWSGLILSGLSLPDPTNADSTLVDAASFAVKFDLLPLFARRFVISEVTLQQPHLSLRQTEDRRWVLLPPRRPAPPTPPAPAVEPPGTEVTAPPAEPKRARPPAYTVELQRFFIEDGSADIVDRTGRPVARLTDVSLDATVTDGHRIAGELRVKRVDFAGQLFLHKVRVTFVREGDRLSVTDARGLFADGKIRAQVDVVLPRKREPQFEVRGSLEDVSLHTLIAEAGGDPRGTAGTLRGEFKLAGNPVSAASLRGNGDFALDEAQLRPMDFVQQIGALLEVDELQLLKLNDAQLHLEVADQRVVVRDLTLRTENMIIRSRGPVRFDGKMRLESRLLINQKLQEKFGSLLGDSFEPSEDANYRQASFSVTGRIDRPEIKNFPGSQLLNFGGLIKGLLRVPKAATPAPAPSPAQTSTPAPNPAP